MNFNYSAMRTRVLAQISRYGIDVTVTNKADSVAVNGIPNYTPGSGVTMATVVSEMTKGAAVDFNIRLVDGQSIRIGDKQVILAAEGLTREPDAGDTLTIEGEHWKLIKILEKIRPADITVAYILQVRK